MSGEYWRVVFFDRDDTGSVNWWPSHEDFADEHAAHQFAVDTMARVGEAEVHHIGGTA